MNAPPPDPFDRALAAYSAREQKRVIAPPAGFVDRTADAVLNRRPWPWKTVSLGTLSALVGVVAIGYMAWPQPPVARPQPVIQVVEPGESVSSPETPNIGDKLSEASGALAKLGRTTAEKATPRAFLPTEFVSGETPRLMPVDSQQGAEAIAVMPAAAKSGLEPMTGSTRRAISLFLRDTGLKAN